MTKIADVLERESRTVDLERGDFERLLGRRERNQRNRRIRAGALGLIVALVSGIVLLRSLRSEGIPADRTEPTPAPAVVSGAFAYGLDGDVYPADPDGSNAMKIAARGVPDEGYAGTVGYDFSSWSPDGRYLAFQRSTLVSTTVLIAEPDGSVIAEVPAEVPASGSSCSPDSTRIAVWGVSQRTLDIYGPDGVRQASLPSPFTGRAAENAPEWTPDGAALLVRGVTILYAALVRDGGASYNSLYRIGVDGSDARLLVDGAMHGQWRPR